MITTHTKESLIAFEQKIAAHFAAGELPSLVHLCGGNEDQLLRIFAKVKKADWVFSTHRNHYHALLKGYPEGPLEEEILKGRSMFMFCRDRNFFSSAILASTCCIAAGVAYDIARCGHSQLQHVWCFLGDGAEEQGHFYEAALFSEANALPITFVIEDNQRQVDTDKGTRRGVNMRDSHAWRPLDHFKCVRRYHYTPTFPHAGAGLPPGTVKFKPEAIARHRANAL